ncbi:ARM repeat-containing protein [Xylariomycetidae sp. FL2044]|nr:ARM repeat-containing protein [Xylariomycetidae sp. FL2044]
MSQVVSTGSPTVRRTPAIKTASMEENIKLGKEDPSVANDSDGPPSLKKTANALEASSLVNQSCPKKMKLNHESSGPSDLSDHNPVDNLLNQLSQQETAINRQGETFNSTPAAQDDSVLHSTLDYKAHSNSVPITPASETFSGSAPATRAASATLKEENPTNDELHRLKLELAQAQNQISRLDQELSQSRYQRSEPEVAMSSSPLDTEFLPVGFQRAPPPPRSSGFNSFNAGAQQFPAKESTSSWAAYDDSRSDTSDALSATGFNRSRNVWGATKQPQGPYASGGLSSPDVPQNGPWNSRAPNSGYPDPSMSYESMGSGGYRGERLTPDYDMTIRPAGNRRSGRFDNRVNSQTFTGPSAFGGNYNNYGPGPYEAGPAMTGPSQGPMSNAAYPGYQPSPVGTPLSPLASEFTSASNSAPWKSEPLSSDDATYLPPTEPLNYRRLLDRSVNCNWKYIVDKIVCNNDQQASIFLQQKLKVGTPKQKYEIVEAIVAQAYPLMVNRFGNFLVQRCFEHGTPEQVTKIADAITGSTLNLSMDPFGCHVVQKAFDSVPEDYKAIMVHELLRRIPDTVIHRYACHVWQKLFELRWSESPPQIMKFVNDALRGMWHEVALGETGSLVVQNIFENCLEEDKRPCIEEVLANIDIVAHGQFGNWCIQHICEHGQPPDQGRAIDHVIRYAAEYSMDQYASKVVEKCLKIGGAEFLSRYLDRVCEGRMDRPRIPLIDIASDQYGNYLIQWILTHAGHQHREIVAAHIRKHMVSLRGSKFGSRVGMLCNNPAVATRPGPGVGGGIGRMPAGPRFNGRAYQ